MAFKSFILKTLAANLKKPQTLAFWKTTFWDENTILKSHLSNNPNSCLTQIAISQISKTTQKDYFWTKSYLPNTPSYNRNSLIL